MDLRILLLALLPFTSKVTAQYNNPESVEYDAAGDRYFVSNTQSDRIKMRTQAGTVTDFVLTPAAPYGLEIMDGVLYACMGNGVRGYSLVTAEEVYYRNLGALFPNGITTDGTHLYITDFHTNARRIYKVDPVGDTHVTLVSATGQQPNGIVWDPADERLVVVFWGSNAPIKAYDRISGAETVLLSGTGLTNIDGITIDCDGNFLVASWTPDAITLYEPTFSQAGVDLGIAGISNPADIDYDATNERVCIPNTSLNTVMLADAPCATTGISQRDGAAMVSYPNPVSNMVSIMPTFLNAEPFELTDLQGGVVRHGTWAPGATLDMDDLAPGMYLLRFLNAGGQLRLVKE